MDRRMVQNPFDNPEFRKEFHEALAPLVTKVEEHEKVIQKGRGVMAVIGVLWAGILALGEYLFHRH